MKTQILLPALLSGLVAMSGIAVAQPAPAEKEEQLPTMDDVFKQLGAQASGTGQIGDRAQIEVLPGYDFLASQSTQTVLRMMGNLTQGNEEGLIRHREGDWFVVFEFGDDGYVKDDEKDKLDAKAILEGLQEGEIHSNKARKEAGLPAQHTVGFAIPPHYDEATQNLEWAIRFTTQGNDGETINHRTKVLGRRGVMDVTLVCDPDQLHSVLPTFRTLMQTYRYVPGETYAEYRKGDKLATYGLIGAVAGGAALMAGKAGLFGFLAKGGKAVFIAIAAVLAGIAKFGKGLFGRRQSSHQE
jgi:uncharacterized membrane-anchored protein